MRVRLKSIEEIKAEHVCENVHDGIYDHDVQLYIVPRMFDLFDKEYDIHSSIFEGERMQYDRIFFEEVYWMFDRTWVEEVFIDKNEFMIL